MIKTIRTLQIVMICLVISSCSFSGFSELNPWYSYNKVEVISVYVEPSSKFRSAISIDVVFIYTQEVADFIGQLDGLKWFELKPMINARYSSEVDTINWEMVPGNEQANRNLPENHKNAVKVLAFMNYPGSIKTSVDLTHLTTPRLVVASEQLIVK